jgi:CO dehydrogenase/acetyl-CoA synthase alpha subunit
MQDPARQLQAARAAIVATLFCYSQKHASIHCHLNRCPFPVVRASHGKKLKARRAWILA